MSLQKPEWLRIKYQEREYVHPDVFEEYGHLCKEMGFKYVASAPLVRSSYQAEKAMAQAQIK